MKKFIVLLLTVVMVFSSAAVFASERDDSTNMIVDTLVLRPLGFAATVVGGVFYIVSLPIAALTKSSDKTYEVLLKDPFEYTFVRPVGDVESEL